MLQANGPLPPRVRSARALGCWAGIALPEPPSSPPPPQEELKGRGRAGPQESFLGGALLLLTPSSQ